MVFLSNQRDLNTLRKSKSNIEKDAMMRLVATALYLMMPDFGLIKGIPAV